MRQIPLPLPHHSSMGPDNFLVTPSNQEAVAWIDAWPSWPTSGLVVTGLSGSGKTHLVQLWLSKSHGRAVLATELEKFDADTTLSETANLAIENADAFAGNSLQEETLFHLFNAVKEIKGSLLLTMTTPVERAGFMLADLRSRLLTLPSTMLGAPDDQLLEALIVKQFGDRQIRVEPGVIAYLALRLPRDAAGITLLIDRLDEAALAEGRKVSIGLAKRILESRHD